MKKINKNKLLILASEFPPGPGGIGTHAYNLAYYLSKEKWQVNVISPQMCATENEINHFNRKHNFKIYRLVSHKNSILKILFRIINILKIIYKIKPDILITSGPRITWIGGFLSKLFNFIWLAVGHGVEFGDTTKIGRLLTRFCFQNADAVVCVSNYTWERMVELNIKPNKGYVINNGANDLFFKKLSDEKITKLRKKLGFENDLLLITVGSLTKRKGQEIVIRSLPFVLKLFNNVHYIMIGLPIEKNKLTELACQLNVINNVHFLGRVDNNKLLEYLNLSDIFIMTSQHTDDGDFEGFGIAVTEAALCGKPAIVASNSGLIEAVEENTTGLIVPEGDENATACAIINLFNNKELREKMGLEARKIALKKYTWKKKVEEYNKILNFLIFNIRI